LPKNPTLTTDNTDNTDLHGSKRFNQGDPKVTVSSDHAFSLARRYPERRTEDAAPNSFCFREARGICSAALTVEILPIPIA